VTSPSPGRVGRATLAEPLPALEVTAHIDLVSDVPLLADEDGARLR
jgi:hypothetical protein